MYFGPFFIFHIKTSAPQIENMKIARAYNFFEENRNQFDTYQKEISHCKNFTYAS